MGTGEGFAPGQAGDAVLDRGLHDGVVVGMEFDDVDAVAVAIMRAQPRTVAMRIEGQRIQFVSGEPAVARKTIREAAATLAGDRLAQGHVVDPEIAGREFGRLVVAHRIRHAPIVRPSGAGRRVPGFRTVTGASRVL